MDVPSRSWVSECRARRVNEWALPGDGMKPRSPGVSDEVSGKLAALSYECYCLRVEAAIDLMEALMKATSWIQDAARIREVSGPET